MKEKAAETWVYQFLLKNTFLCPRVSWHLLISVLCKWEKSFSYITQNYSNLVLILSILVIWTHKSSWAFITSIKDFI